MYDDINVVPTKIKFRIHMKINLKKYDQNTVKQNCVENL